MDLKILHFKCQRAVRNAFEEFKSSIINSIFEVDESIVKTELASMKQSIGIKMNNWFMDCNYSNKQYPYMKDVIKYYEEIAIKTALRFSRKYYSKT